MDIILNAYEHQQENNNGFSGNQKSTRFCFGGLKESLPTHTNFNKRRRRKRREEEKRKRRKEKEWSIYFGLVQMIVGEPNPNLCWNWHAESCTTSNKSKALAGTQLGAREYFSSPYPMLWNRHPNGATQIWVGVDQWRRTKTDWSRSEEQGCCEELWLRSCEELCCSWSRSLLHLIYLLVNPSLPKTPTSHLCSMLIWWSEPDTCPHTSLACF